MREFALKARPPIIGHPSFADAVRHNQRLPLQRAAAETSERIAHRVVARGCWQDSQVALLLEGGISLVFRADRVAVPWQLQDEPAFDAAHASWSSDREPIRLIRQSVNGALLTRVMDRAAMMPDFIGRRARRIVVDEFGTYLHFDHDRRYLSLHAQVIKASEQPLLEWFEDAD